MLNAERSTPNA